MATKRWFARKELYSKSEKITFDVSAANQLVRSINGGPEVQIAVITDLPGPGELVTPGAQTWQGTKRFQDGIQLDANTAILNFYDKISGSTAPTFFPGVGTSVDGLTVRGVAAATVPWTLERIGDLVTLRVAQFTVTADSGDTNGWVALQDFIPPAYRPAYPVRDAKDLLHNNIAQIAPVHVNTGGDFQILPDISPGPNAVPPYGLLNDDITMTWVATPLP